VTGAVPRHRVAARHDVSLKTFPDGPFDALGLNASEPNSFTRVRETPVSLGTILLMTLVLLLIGTLPRWSHSRNWAYAPISGVALVMVILVVLLLTGRL
jgi:hypothetical protein